MVTGLDRPLSTRKIINDKLIFKVLERLIF